MKEDVCRRTMPVDRWAVGEHHQVASRHAPHHHVAIAGANQNAACEEQITRTRFVHFERAALVEALGEHFRETFGHMLHHDDGRQKIAWDLREDRKSTRLNSSHTVISYAVFCLK